MAAKPPPPPPPKKKKPVPKKGNNWREEHRVKTPNRPWNNPKVDDVAIDEATAGDKKLRKESVREVYDEQETAFQALEMLPDFKDPKWHVNLTHSRRTKLDFFVREYLVDFSATQACLRIGVPNTKAIQYGYIYLQHPYTQFVLREVLDKMDEKLVVTRNRVLGWLVREANYYGPDGGASARVQALGRLAKCLGMEVQKLDVDVNGTIHHVMEVPAIPTVDSWESKATDAQAKLKQLVVEV